MGNQYKEWTKEEVIKAIQDFYSKNGKTPRSNEFLGKNGLPSYAHTRKILNCILIEDIFSLCNLERTEAIVGGKIDKEFGLNKLIEYTNLLGKIPTREDFSNNNWTPWHGWYSNNFGSFENACYLAGVAEIPLTDGERVDLSIEELRKLANKLDKCPTVAEYESIKHRGFSRRELERRLNIKYNIICKTYIPKHIINHNLDIPKEEIFEYMKNMLDKNDGAMTYDQMKESGMPYSQTIFESKCNMTFNEIIEYLGYTPVGSTTMIRTKDEMLKDFNDLFIKLKRIPYHNDMNNNSNIASAGTYIRYFESIENVCKILNIDYKKYYKGAGAGKICFDKNGGMCKSLEECNITNFFIDNELIFIKQPKYKELIEGDKRILDWKVFVNNEWKYVEYAGMYSDKPSGSIGRRYKDKIEKKIEDLTEYGFIEKCLFIFPNDVKTKTLKEIFEPFLGIELKHVENTYNVSIRECFSMTDEQLLEIIMPYSKNQDILPSTGVISKKESGVYHEIIKRYKKYSNFAKHFEKKIISNNIDHQASI